MRTQAGSHRAGRSARGARRSAATAGRAAGRRGRGFGPPVVWLVASAVTGVALLATLVVTGRFPLGGRAAAPVVADAPMSAGAGPGSSAAKPSVGCGPWECAQLARLKAAESLVPREPGTLGIVVRDRVTGAFWRAGDPGHVMWTSSTIKLAIVVSVLERGRAGQVTVDAAARAQLTAMLDVSDNEAADAVWNRYGRDAMVPRFQQVYGMTGLTFVPGFSRYWGFMKCSAEDLQRLMTYALERLDPADREYVTGAMRGVGAIQRWGVWAAGAPQRPGTKDGWSVETDGGVEHWCTSTVGFAGPDARYVVAVMDDLPAGSTIEAGVHAVSDVVATVFGAPTPASVTVPDPSTGP